MQTSLGRSISKSNSKTNFAETQQIQAAQYTRHDTNKRVMELHKNLNSDIIMRLTTEEEGRELDPDPVYGQQVLNSLVGHKNSEILLKKGEEALRG